MNLFDLAATEFAVRFEDPQKVAGLDRDVLADVTHEEHAHVVLLRQSEQLRSLPIGLQSCFIADHDRVSQSAPLLRVAQEVLDGRRLGKPFTSQHSCRRRRRRDGKDGVPGFTQSALHFPQRRRFSGSCHTTKTEDPISCAENRGNGLLLFLGEMRSWNKAGVQRGAGVPWCHRRTSRPAVPARKPCRVQHSESNWFSGESVRRTSPRFSI